MSKELEALSYLVETAIYGNKENNRGKIFEAEGILKQSLTPPPTGKEVCKTLSEYLKRTVVYDNTLKTFTEIKGGRARGRIIARLRVNKLNIPHDLPPHLVTMICRFYEGK
jgi:hypothetical protein